MSTAETLLPVMEQAVDVVAMRDAITTHSLDTLAGTMLLATGEPCGLCYRYAIDHAIDHGIDTVYVAVDRDEVADLGFDYRPSYPVFGITDTRRSELIRLLAVDPFTHYLNLQLSGHALARPGIVTTGQTS